MAGGLTAVDEFLISHPVRGRAAAFNQLSSCILRGARPRFTRARRGGARESASGITAVQSLRAEFMPTVN